MPGRTALVGFRRRPPGCDTPRFESFAVKALATRQLDSFAWIALGEDAIGILDPVTASAGFDGRPARVILCSTRLDAITAHVWGRLDVTRTAAPDELAGLEILRRRIFERPTSPLHEWTGRSVLSGTRLAIALESLERVQPLGTTRWLSELRWSSETVRGWCQREFGRSCCDVVRRYRLFLADAMQAQRFAVWEIAEAVGVCDESAVYRLRREERDWEKRVAARPGVSTACEFASSNLANSPVAYPSDRPTPGTAERSAAAQGDDARVVRGVSCAQFAEAFGRGSFAAAVASRSDCHRAGVSAASSAVEIDPTRPRTSWKYAIGSAPAALQLSISE